MEQELILSALPKTWIFDLDGTLVKHNGYLTDGTDILLDGAREYLAEIPAEDKIIILTARGREYEKMTRDFLELNQIRYDRILFQMPAGERILINDRKPSGISMAVAIDMDRDVFAMPAIHRIL